MSEKDQIDQIFAWYAPSIDDTCTHAKKAQRERDLPDLARLFTVPLYARAKPAQPIIRDAVASKIDGQPCERCKECRTGKRCRNLPYEAPADLPTWGRLVGEPK